MFSNPAPLKHLIKLILYIMKAFFEGIEYLFVNVLFAPLDFLRSLELKSWFAANSINWIFMIICAAAMLYWIKQLRIFDEAGTENQDTTAHSFLK
ncbi:hypothetical protein BC624_102228 [Flavobacterium granuli]|uniref:Uracil phosphoribosyltransferase n=2 Tax=Flavobacterium granuli TaxID=280093 RepID=A0A1M5KEP8_9FLAO|nr:hypothetical protein BC624_102228 [Flavobacterium granuli]SHG51201.1 hypothetical protein SAMN05443373_102228 [Flavobacterium granuli]